MSSQQASYREPFAGRKRYHMGRWWIRGGAGVWSAPAYVSRYRNNRELRTPRVSIRGPINAYGITQG